MPGNSTQVRDVAKGLLPSFRSFTNISLVTWFNFFRELQMALEQERAQKRANMMKFSTRYFKFFYRQNILLSDFEYFFVLPKWNWLDTHRHSRFGGTYVVQNMKSISDRDVIFHKNQKDVSNLTFDINKKPKKRPKNRQPIKDQEVTRRSTLSIRLGLKEFCTQFLESCYNPLMYAVKVQTAKLSFLSLDVTCKENHGNPLQITCFLINWCYESALLQIVFTHRSTSLLALRISIY